MAAIERVPFGAFGHRADPVSSASPRRLRPSVARMPSEARLIASNAGYVAAGAAGGALLRYGLSEYAKKRGQGPTAILMINVLGSFILGGVTATVPATPAALLFGTGFCGAFTTFSTFSVDAITMIRAGQMERAAAYVAGTNVLSIGAAYAGLTLGATPAASRFVAAATGKLGPRGAAAFGFVRPPPLLKSSIVEPAKKPPTRPT